MNLYSVISKSRLFVILYPAISKSTPLFFLLPVLIVNLASADSMWTAVMPSDVWSCHILQVANPVLLSWTSPFYDLSTVLYELNRVCSVLFSYIAMLWLCSIWNYHGTHLALNVFSLQEQSSVVWQRNAGVGIICVNARFSDASFLAIAGIRAI